MAEFTLELDEQTLERARRFAALRHSSVEALIKEVIDLLVLAEKEGDPIVGMFAQEPELIDQIVASAMSARETDPLRLSTGSSISTTTNGEKNE
jgi:hypothetical protein